MENKLDISALEKAAKAFENSLAFALKVEEKTAEIQVFFEREIARAAVIQHFEFTYELCWKTMKRYIEMDIGAEADILTRKDLFRLAAERRLITSFDQWVEFHQARNRTSHVYDEEVADEVYEITKAFINPLKEFLITMKERI